MASLDNQQTWLPYPDTKDCSQGLCSQYCPQWCYITFPPPPPLDFPREGSGAHFSPLVIAIIGMLASSFLLISYYIVASKYCRNQDSSRRRSQRDSDEEFNDSRNPSGHETWQVATSGLDEALIKSITVHKYKRGGGLVEGTDCAVCLSEFQENESLRLLPKCSHAFHLPCIDMWLKSHSNCPLCRTSVVLTTLPPQLPPLMQESIPDHASSIENQHESDTVVTAIDLETGEDELSLASGSHVSKSPVEALSDVDAPHERDTIIEIRDEEIRPIRRTFSMDSFQDRISIADLLSMSMGDDCRVNDKGNLHFPMDVGSSEQHGGEYSKTNSRSRALHSVMNPTAMKRSSSSGRLSTRHGKGRNSALLI